jgi:hypothetical protein
LVVDLELGVNKQLNRVLDVVAESSEEGACNRIEDDLDCFIAQIGVSDDVEVTLKSLGKDSTATARLAHSSDKDDVLNL